MLGNYSTSVDKRQKPPGNISVNYRHPLAKNLVLAMPFSEGAGSPAEIITKTKQITYSANGWVPTKSGVAYYAAAAQNQIVHPNWQLVDSSLASTASGLPFSVFTVVNCVGTPGAFSTIIALDTWYSNPSISLFFGSSGFPRFQYTDGITAGATNDTLLQGSVNPGAGFHTLCGTHGIGAQTLKTSTAALYVDGLLITSTAAAVHPGGTGKTVSPGTGTNNLCLAFYIFNKELTAYEVKNLHDAPYDLFNFTNYSGLGIGAGFNVSRNIRNTLF